MGNGDNFALDWIRGELESTLDQARAALESYAEGGREETRLRSCLTSLHQVHGTLRMLELDGVVLLADHMEQTAQSLLNGSIRDSRLAEQSLMQSILQLPAFIQEVQNGITEDLPLVMPYVNELRECCGLSPMQLTPQITAEFTADQAAEAMRRFRGINGADKAARVRSAYQQVLLSVLKGGASSQTVETLGKIAIGMQRICEGAPLATLWKALEHFAKGYASDPQKMSSEAIRDLRRVDAEMKKVATVGAEVLVEPLPVELVRDLLRAAEARGERDERITELRSSVQTPQAAQIIPREALGQAADVLREQIAAVRDQFDLFARGSDRKLAELQEITGSLDGICSTLGMLGDSHGADLLRAQRAQILSFAEDADVTDDVILGLASALVQTEQALSGSGSISSGDEALALAALNEAQLAVLHEARSGIDQVKQSIVDFVSSKWNTGYLDEAPGVLAAVQGALKMIPLPRAAELLAECSRYVTNQLQQGHHPDWQELDAFADALGGIDYFLERLFDTGRVPGDEALDLTEESLKKLLTGDDTPSLESVGDGFVGDAFVDSGGGDVALTAMLGARPEELRFLSEADVEADTEQDDRNYSSLQAVPSEHLDQTDVTAETGSSEAPFDLVELEEESREDADHHSLQDDQAGDAVEELQTETVVEAHDAAELEADEVDLTQTSFVDSSIPDTTQEEPISAGSSAFQAGSIADSKAGATSAPADLAESVTAAESSMVAEPEVPAVDPEIVEIFVEEVDEVLEAIEAQLPDWSEDLTAVAPITEIRRNFHTLKGSGRIVGANQIGELGWAIENMLNRLMDGTIAPSEDHLFVVSHACSIVPELRADFAEGRATDRTDLIELLEQVDVLASGGVLSSALASARPVIDEPDSLDEEDFPIWDDGDLDSEVIEAQDYSVESVEVGLAEADSEARAPSVDVPSFLTGVNDGAEDALIDDVAEDSRVLFAEELREHLEILGDRIRSSLADDTLELDSPFTRALHTIAGSAATAGEFAVVGIAEPLQDVTSAVLRERHGVLVGEFLAFVREGVYALQRLLDIDALGQDSPEDDSAMFAAEAQRLLDGLLESSDASTSLLEIDDTSVLLDAREYLDRWRFGSLDLERAEQMNRALVTVIERAHSDDFADLAEVLLLAHNQFADQPLDEERHYALVAAHDDLLTQLDALAAGQVANMTLQSRERLQDLIGESSGPMVTEEFSEPEERVLAVQDLVSDESQHDATSFEDGLDDDAQEALAYKLDESDAFDLEALDDELFAADDMSSELVSIEDFAEPPSEFDDQESLEEPFPADPQSTVDLAAGFEFADSESSPAEPHKETQTLEDDEEVDLELLAIFFEEADELLEEFDHNLQDWSTDRSNGAPLENLLRGLHTLKGGARLAGLSQLGDMTHDYESELIEVQNTAVSDVQFESIQQRYDNLVEAVTLARNNEPLPRGFGATDESDAGPMRLANASITSTPAVDDDFALDVAEAFSVEAIAHIDAEEAEEAQTRQAEVRESQEQAAAEQAESDRSERVKANDASMAATALSGLSDEVAEVVPLLPEPDELDSPFSRALQVAEPEISAESTPTHDDERSRNSQEMVRVSATLLENLVNLAGESSIVRARVEQGISDFGSALEEMETTIERVREQLRRLEIETETRVSSRVERSQGPAYEDFDPLEMDRYSQLQELTRSLTESATDMMDLKETLRYRARESETLLLQQARLNTELQEGLMRTRMVPFSRLMPRLRRIVRQVSRDLGKQVEFQAYNAEGELDRNVLERMVPPLEHMLRNAIDHGIESEDLRHSFGKPTIGHISLKLSREGGDVVIQIADDGAGIDVETVRAKAVERGLMARDASLTDEQVLDFVLAPGFSTAASLTQISGRGVGMDVVHSEVKQLGGSIEIGSVPGRGTTFTVRLPFTVSVNRALMVSLGDDQYAIPLNTIEGIVLLPTDELSKHYGPQGAPFEYAGVPYRVRYLGSYLGREYVSRSDQTSVPVVLVRSGEQAVAVHVDDVQGSREIVVKSLGPQFAGVGGISGATILGDGSVVIILDLLSLMRTRGVGKNVETRQPSSVEEERWVLVVDDSVTVRKVTSRLLERQGMNVITAKDGVEAISALQERLPDIVLLDIEMPRMDGFEVARQVRHDERLAGLPIVMISSRTGEKHTERARALGVNRFLGKPFQENELLEVIDELVKRS